MRSIRSKLALFVAGLCLLLIGLVWLLMVFLFEPHYHRMIDQDLSRRLAGIVKVAEEADAISQMAQELDQYVGEGICIDISDGSLTCVGFSEGIGSGCLLHKNHTDIFGFGRNNMDTVTAIRLRQQTARQGRLHHTLEEDPGGGRQLVVGAVTENGYTILVSTGLERVTQAQNALQSQLVTVTVVLLAVSLVSALLFSRWFTRPITALSQAARRVAAGDYSVSLTPTGHDEIAALTRDFNEMTREVARTSRLQKDLLANISHDLRTPLTLIRGYAETVRDLDGEDKIRRDQDLEIIIDESDRLSALVNSVLELSKYSSGAMQPKPAPFDLAELAADVLARYSDRAQKEGFTLLQEGPAEAFVLADAAQIERVLHNLVANAANHLPAEKGLLTLRLSAAAGRVRAEVTDNGCGIKKEELPHLFDRYYRARNNEGRPGSGLGLSIVKAILVAHDAGFGVRSAEGAGSTFWFELPAAKLSEE